MTRIEYRPLTANERRQLASLASSRSDLGNDLAGGGCVFMLVFGVGMVALRLVDLQRSSWQAAAAIVAGIVAIATMLYMRKGRAKWTSRQDYAADLEGGRAAEVTYDVVDAIRVEEFEDEGSNYFLKLADNKVLFLTGQYLYDSEEGNAFPSTRIRVTRAPRSRLMLDLECLGTPLQPSTTRPPFSHEDHRSGRVPKDGEMLDVDFETLRAAKS